MSISFTFCLRPSSDSLYFPHSCATLFDARVFVWQNRYVSSLLNCIKSRMQNRFINFSHKIFKVLPGFFLVLNPLCRNELEMILKIFTAKTAKIYVGSFVDSKSIFMTVRLKSNAKSLRCCSMCCCFWFINILAGAKLWTSAYLEFIELWAYLVVESSYTE